MSKSHNIALTYISIDQYCANMIASRKDAIAIHAGQVLEPVYFLIILHQPSPCIRIMHAYTGHIAGFLVNISTIDSFAS